EDARQDGRATDAADGQDSVGVQPQFGDGLLQRVQDAEVAATGAPIRVSATLEVFDPQRGSFLNCGNHVRPLNQDLVDWNVLFGRFAQHRFHAVDDVVWHKRLAVVFADVAIWHEARFGAQVARKLAA